MISPSSFTTFKSLFDNVPIALARRTPYVGHTAPFKEAKIAQPAAKHLWSFKIEKT